MSPPRPIPFIDLKAQYGRLRDAIDRRIRAVLDHGQFILGPEVAEFERALCALTGAGHAVGVSSGTDALEIALMAEEIGPGDAVFVPSFTFPATAEVVVGVGAEPVFVDSDIETWNVDPADLEQRIAAVEREGRLRPRAVIAVDLYGLPAPYEALRGLAATLGLALIADAAQSLGGSLDGVPVGRLASVTATSFFPAKPLGCYGDGGALFTDDARRAELFRSIRAHGQGKAKYDIVRAGRNARLDTLQAAILMAKLEVFADEIAARERIARQYDRHLAGHVVLPARPQGARCAWAQYTVLVEGRDEVCAELKAQNIPTMVYYPRPLHLQPAFARYGTGPGSLPASERLSSQVLSLPMHPYLEADTCDRIASALISALGGRSPVP